MMSEHHKRRRASTTTTGYHDKPDFIMSARTDVEAEQSQHSSGVTPETLRSRLIERLGAQHVDIADLSGEIWRYGAWMVQLMCRV